MKKLETNYFRVKNLKNCNKHDIISNVFVHTKNEEKLITWQNNNSPVKLWTTQLFL